MLDEWAPSGSAPVLYTLVRMCAKAALPGDIFRFACFVPEDVVSREIEGETVILDLKHGTYFGLDAVGTRIWQLLVEHGRVLPAFEALLTEYDVDEGTLRADLTELLSQLRDKDLLRLTA